MCGCRSGGFGDIVDRMAHVCRHTTTVSCDAMMLTDVLANPSPSSGAGFHYGNEGGFIR